MVLGELSELKLITLKMVVRTVEYNYNFSYSHIMIAVYQIHVQRAVM